MIFVTQVCEWSEAGETMPGGYCGLGTYLTWDIDCWLCPDSQQILLQLSKICALSIIAFVSAGSRDASSISLANLCIAEPWMRSVMYLRPNQGTLLNFSELKSFLLVCRRNSVSPISAYTFQSCVGYVWSVVLRVVWTCCSVAVRMR